MDMKWTPIIDGDLSGIPTEEEFLFTVVDTKNGKTYATEAYIIDYGWKSEVWETTPCGLKIHGAKNVKAWTERPEPFKLGRCDMCKHWKEWIDEFGDECAECELIVNPPFLLSTQQHFKCPLDR